MFKCVNSHHLCWGSQGHLGANFCSRVSDLPWFPPHPQVLPPCPPSPVLLPSPTDARVSLKKFNARLHQELLLSGSKGALLGTNPPPHQGGVWGAGSGCEQPRKAHRDSPHGAGAFSRDSLGSDGESRAMNISLTAHLQQQRRNAPEAFSPRATSPAAVND